MYTLEPENKSSGCLLKALAAIGALTMGFLVLLVVIGLAGSGSTSSVNATSTLHQVVYKITTDRETGRYPDCFYFGTTYQAPNGAAQKEVAICGGAQSIVVDTFRVEPGDFVYLSVQNSEYSAKISCEILIDNELIYQTFSEGKYVIASCSGLVP